ncbi:MAG: dTDP-4-dehydrorhamnose 3,5-epimerase [Candidatus Hydrogenedentota bacterium]|nr:MAG: dTDP-4-dehydrorhamnose 3,5-epimerase [Candidatus Hydrogenedentota bacterium]
MKFIEQSIKGVFLIEPKVFQDSRGYFCETFRQDLFRKHIGEIEFVQDNESQSSKGVLRGLHYQLPPYAQSKLVRVVQGEIFDVAVDIRKNSPTFGKYVSAILSGENKKQFFIPHGFAHGFLVLSESAIVHYKVDNFYSKEHERGIYYDTGIDWPKLDIPFTLSDKDNNLPVLEKADIFTE